MKPRPWRSGLAALVAVGAAPKLARAASVAKDTQAQLRALHDFGFTQELNRLVNRPSPVTIPSVGQVVSDLLHRKSPFDPSILLKSVEYAILGDFSQMARVLGILFILAVLAGLLERLAESTEVSEVVRIARWVVFSAFITVGLRSFAVALGLVHHMVGSLVHLMEAMMPTVIVLMAGSGAMTSAGIFGPLMMGTMNIVAVLTENWVLPAMMLATVVELVAYWLPRFSLKNLGLLFRQIGLTMLGGLMTLFLAVLAVEGAAGSVADGVLLRGSKFLMGTFVPVIGNAIADAMETILGSSLLLKNAVSLVGALAIIVAVTFPLAKLLVMMFLYRVAASATEPLAVEGVAQSLNVMATAIGWLIAVGGAVALMFFLLTAVVLSASNGVIP